MIKSTRLRSTLSASTILAAGLLVVVAPAQAQNLPDTGNVSVSTSGLSGGAPGSTNPGFSTSGAAGAQTLRVDLKDNRTILNWGGAGFNVAAGNTIDFKDARATAGVTGRTDNIAVLNRDLSGSTSNILGTIKSDPNVAVYLLNQSGILFGSNAVVNTGAFFAGTSNLSDDNDFLNAATTLRFSGSTGGTVTANAGSQFTTASSASSNGGRMGDLVMMGSSVIFRGTAGSATSGGVSGDAALVAADDAAITNAPGSPLIIQIYKGTALFNAIEVGTASTIRAGNVTVAYSKTGGSGGTGPNINVLGNLVATSAKATDSGVVLSAGVSVGNVTIASGATDGTGAIADSGKINSASKIEAQSKGELRFSNILTAAGAVKLRAGDAIITGNVTAGDDDLDIQTTGALTINLSTPGTTFKARNLVSGGAMSLTADTINVGQSFGYTVGPGGVAASGDLTINVGNSLLVLGKTSGRSINITQTSSAPNAYVQLYGDAASGSGDIVINTMSGLSLANVTSAGKLKAHSDSYLVTQAGLNAATGIDLSSTSNAVRADTVYTAHGDIIVSGAGVTISNAFALDGNIRLSSVAGGVTLGGLFSNSYYYGGNSSASGDIIITAFGNASMLGNVTAGGNIAISSSDGGVALGNLNSNSSAIKAQGSITAAGRAYVDFESGLTLTGNSDGIGEEPITVESHGTIALGLGGHILGGPSRESDLRIRTYGTPYIYLDNIEARGLLGAFGDEPNFTNMLTATGSVSFGGINVFTNSLRVKAESFGVGGNVTVTNGDIDFTGTTGGFIRALVTASGNITMRSGADLSLDTGTKLSATDIVLSAAAAFSNNVGSAAVSASDRWVIYSANPNADTFGGLDSHATALWNSTIATRDPSTIIGNRYVFSYAPILTVSASNDISKVYGTQLDGSSVAWVVSGYQPGVVGAFLGDTPATTFSGSPLIVSAGFDARASVAGGPYPIGLGKGTLHSDLGYVFAFDPGQWVTITPKNLIGGIMVDNKVYDGTTAGTGSVTLNGVVSGDTVSTSGTIFTFADKNAGIGKTVAVTGTMLTGADASNYTITLPAGVVADILKKDITGTITANNKTYDGTRVGTGTVTLNGIIAGDSVGTSGTTFTFSDKNAGGSKVVTVSGTVLTGFDARNYVLTVPASALADILRKAITASVVANNKTYDGTTTGTGTVTLNGVVASDAVGTSGTTFTFSDKNAGTGKTVAIAGTTLTGADAGNYTFTIPASAVADILKKTLTANVTANNKTYDGTTAGTGTVALNGVIAGDVVGTGGTTFTFSDKNAGVRKSVTAAGTTLTGADAGNYTLTIAGPLFADILKKAITGGVAVDNKTYDGTATGTGTVTLNGVVAGDAVGTSGTTFTFSDKNAGIGKTVAVGGTTLTGGDASNYTLTIPASALADILKKALTANVTANTKTYDGTTLGTGTVTLNGVISGDAVGTSGTNFTFSDKNAGTGKTVAVAGTTLTGADAGNYTLTVPASAFADILKKALTANVIANNKTYDGTAAGTGTVTLNGVVAGDAVGTSGTSFTFADRNAGATKTVTVAGTTLTGTDAGNYTLTVPASVFADILKKAITASVTANGKTYDGATTGTGTVALNGVLSGDTVGTAGTTFTFADKNAGTGKTVTVAGTTLTGADAGNYTVTVPAAALADILRKAITASVVANNKTYDGTATGTGAVTLNGVVAGDAVSTNGTTFTFSDKNAGTGKTVTVAGTMLTGTDAGNYTVTVPASALADILRKSLTASVVAGNKTYDGTTSGTGTITLNGVVSGDTVGTSGTTFTFADKNAGAGKTVNVAGTTLTGADAGNYTVTVPASALADILKKAITASVAVTSKTYDGTTAGSGTVTLNGVVSGDNVTTSGTTFTYADKNAGTGKAVTVAGTTIGGADAGNYTITIPASALGDILKRALSVKADDASKVQNDPDPALTYTLTSGSLVSGDAFSGNLARDTGENPGTYAIKIGTLNAGDNYTITFTPGTFTINLPLGSEGLQPALKAQPLPSQIGTGTSSGSSVNLDISAVCGDDKNCTTGGPTK
ncbi:YDG domain-containing protein [Sphingomonas sp.]|uniref:YDG domain-containing protein n=1 Tax=Sphingomonas sp. TaxID=28214 RepID=UPI0025EE69F7|nr:YDG domain-containing protein [Sphingomonas sp.]